MDRRLRCQTSHTACLRSPALGISWLRNWSAQLIWLRPLYGENGFYREAKALEASLGNPTSPPVCPDVRVSLFGAIHAGWCLPCNPPIIIHSHIVQEQSSASWCFMQDQPQGRVPKRDGFDSRSEHITRLQVPSLARTGMGSNPLMFLSHIFVSPPALKISKKHILK